MKGFARFVDRAALTQRRRRLLHTVTQLRDQERDQSPEPGESVQESEPPGPVPAA